MVWSLVVLVVAYLAVMAYRLLRFVRANRVAAALTTAYFRDGDAAGRHLLVLGDSTMYGAGIKDRQQTIGGLLAAKYPGASLETYAANGARIRDVAAQLAQARHRHYDMVLLGVGGNDIVKFSSYRHAQADLKDALSKLSMLSDRVVLCHSVNVGNIGFFLPPFNYLYDYRSRRLSQMYIVTVSAFPKVKYVNFYRRLGQDHYDRQSRQRFLADDSFHPNEYANKYFFNIIWRQIEK
jgi:lysophospholipase L1-like esterase